MTSTEPAAIPSPDGRRAARNGRRRRSALLAAATLAAVAATLIAPRSAGAGSYVVRQCTPETPATQASWTRTSDGYRQRARCASGGGLQVHQLGGRTPAGRYGAWVWKAPPGTLFASLRVSASLTRHAGHRGELRGVPATGPAFGFGGRHRSFRAYSRRRELERFEARLRCVAPDGCGRADDDRAHAYVKQVRLRVRDRAAPRVRSVRGDLLRGRVARGERSLSFDARDRGGGLRRLFVTANGTRLGPATALDCNLGAGLAARLVPCPRAASATRPVATGVAALRTGPNVVAACAEDLALAGRANRGCERRRVWVDNACPSSSPDGRRLTAGFRSGGRRATVRSDHRAFLAGRLTDEAGRPVAGATVCALTRTQRPAPKVRLAATRRTGPDGRYSIPLPPGPSRRVFVHQADRDSVRSRHGLALRSRARPALRVRSPHRPRRGDRLRFRGRIPGPACAGRVVEVEARLKPGRWQVFRAARTTRSCRYRAVYRLRATTGPAAYRFRARVRAQPGYPFAGGVSAVRTKRVG